MSWIGFGLEGCERCDGFAAIGNDDRLFVRGNFYPLIGFLLKLLNTDFLHALIFAYRKLNFNKTESAEMDRQELRMGLHQTLPNELYKLILRYDSTPVPIGESGAMVYRLTKINSPTYYLKISAIEKLSLTMEAQILEWLRNKLPVPEVISYLVDEQKEYLLTSEIEGIDAAQSCGDKPHKEIVTLLAEGLRMIHDISIEHCPFNRTLNKTIADAERQMKLGLADVGDFDEARQGETAEQLYKQLLSTRPDSEDLVFTHGDYCLPNIILGNNNLNGFVDWSRAGTADRYQDLALAARSLDFNISSNLTEQLFEEYGIEQIDWAKVEYYTLLDEFF
jgi:aminoglycoside phosphotransferase